MSWRPNKQKSNSRQAMDTTSGANWQPIVVIVLCVVLGIPATIVAFKAVSFIEESHALVFLGIAVACGMFGLFMVGFTAFLRAYAQLRNADDAEDRKRELDFMKAYIQITKGRSGSTTIRLPDQAGAGAGWGPDVGASGPSTYQPPTIPYNEPVELQ